MFLVLLGLDLVGLINSPYLGILTFIVLPGLFILGLLLIPLARYLEARGRKTGIVVDLSDHDHQERAVILFGLTVVNVVIFSVATYRGVEFTDSNAFCGQVCHEVMEPQYTAYLNSPHSRVPCVSCHIGSGADYFVRYKINGLSQVAAVMMNSYPTPIPTPVANLRPARETCETCHWPAQFHGDKLLVKSRFQEDEANTRLDSVMLLKVGGGGPERGFSTGIHRHASHDQTVTYIATDRARQEIVWVEVANKAGEKFVYTKSGVPISDSLLAHGERHRMDCMDCHNRPTHVFRSPDDALDRAFLSGRLDRGLPQAKKLGMQLLTSEYASKDEAVASIPLKVDAFYRENYPDVYGDFRASIAAAGETIRDTYAANVFPSMKITWGTYANHIGHRDGGGCFRCHAGDHASADGREIASDCDACHTMLAMEEKDPAILGQLFPQAEGTKLWP